MQRKTDARPRPSFARVAATFAAALVFPSAALAECGQGACNDVKITYFYVDGSNASWLSTSGNETLLNQCAADGGVLLKIDPLRANADWLYSTALSAFMANQTVSVRVDPTVPGTCTIAYITMGKL
ncbi:hypothetical protein Q9Q95_04930 [Sphingomonas sp. DG1-23]|jgi:hypothetical protein|uniref:hypothetical protein n=1 Tax=Sphingomonas sp. DG1-23 TaxID=3068316 RepID=UPI00273EF486|nr:hypothetical protein [Sphingomonas sp. DG1-23]MDP5278260.1 hypothetical protein [Sphingomonas sp. DG1-23]